MNKLKTMLCAVFTLLLVNTAQADSGNMAGPYIGFQLTAAGISMDGTSNAGAVNTTGTDANAAGQSSDDVNIGKAAAIAGWEIGYAVPVGSWLLLDIGASYLSGEAKIEALTDDIAAKGNASFSVDDVRTYYIAPTIALSDTASFYVKIGLSEADVGVTGDITTPADLSGRNLAMGTRMVLDSGIFIRTEAGMVEYNGISAHGKAEATNAIPTTTSYSAEPTIAYGSISMGMRF